MGSSFTETLFEAAHMFPYVLLRNNPPKVIYFLFAAENFQKVLSTTSIHKAAPFDFDSAFVKQYFGQKKSTKLDYFEFVQLLQVWEGKGGIF